MKLLKFLIPVIILLMTAIIITSPISSCNKKVLIHDTTTVHDTTIVKDTVTIIDTVGCCNINSDMIAYYTFTGGSLKDSSGNHNDIIFNNAAMTTDRFGNANGAYLFDGSTSYMRVTNSATLSPAHAITIMAIVKANGFYQGQCHGNQILGKGYPDYATGWYAMRYTDPTTDCNVAPNPAAEQFGGVYGDNNPQGTAVGAGPDSVHVQTGKWYTLIFTYDGAVANFYINGVLKDSRTKTVTFTANSNDLLIGKHEDPPFPYWFNGVIDEIRIYNKALCSTAVQKLSGVSGY